MPIRCAGGPDGPPHSAFRLPVRIDRGERRNPGEARLPELPHVPHEGHAVDESQFFRPGIGRVRLPRERVAGGVSAHSSPASSAV